MPKVAINVTTPYSKASSLVSQEIPPLANGRNGEHTTESTGIRKDELAAASAIENKTVQKAEESRRKKV